MRRKILAIAIALTLVLGVGAVALGHTFTGVHSTMAGDCWHGLTTSGGGGGTAHSQHWSSSWPYWNWTIKRKVYYYDLVAGWVYNHTHSATHWGDPPCA